MKNLPSLLLLVFPLILTAQNAVVNDIPWPEKGIWPESPRARAFREVAMPSPGLLTGACEFSVPLYTLEVKDLSLPLQLNYRSNGIRVEDDPCPVGYGWVLSPALRITRQIMGRPDEYFKFAGENFHVNPGEDYQYGFRSTTIIGAELVTDAYRADRYDTEHDIFTIHLIDKTFNVIFHENKFVGANIGEYKIENDSALSHIKVTDPKGIIYEFSIQGQRFSELCRTEWLLNSIILPSGHTLWFSWEAEVHHEGIKNTYGALTLRYDNLRYFDENDPQKYPANNNGLQNEKNLKSITFADGCIEFSYVNDMLESMRVKWNNPSSQVYTTRFIHDFGDLTKGKLLKGIVSSSEGTYTFRYNDTAFPDTGAIDWWGFYNGVNNNHIFYPTVKLVKGQFPRDHTIYGANKSPVADKMQANILTNAILPTGGCIEWEYEPHRFAPHGNESEIRSLIEEPILSFGGGLRVKKITMRENMSDSSGMVKHYIYGEGGNHLAVVWATKRSV